MCSQSDRNLFTLRRYPLIWDAIHDDSSDR
ncbi:hypothetical protein H4I96_09161 [Botrytis cinerea]